MAPAGTFSISFPKASVSKSGPEELAKTKQIMDTIDQALAFGQGIVSRLTKLDAANLVWLLAIVLGYVLKFVSVFPNKFIPVASFVFTVSSYIVMTGEPGQPLRDFWMDLVLGILFWGFAWGLHKAVLSKHIDKKLFGEDEEEKPKP